MRFAVQANVVFVFSDSVSRLEVSGDALQYFGFESNALPSSVT
jgi:hypothetical protein